jgi:inosose dehydratase
MNIKIGNAPCSWGTLEFEGMGKPIPYNQMLDELRESGYQGTELGDWGYFPTDSSKLCEELSNRGLELLGAFVPVGLKYSANHDDGLKNALKIASFQREVAKKMKSQTNPFLVLSDNNGTDPIRTQFAGKITKDMELAPKEWKTFCFGADLIAKAVFEETGLKTVFHHHCAGFVETPSEIDQLLENTDPKYLGLVLDTGHYSFGRNSQGPSLLEALDRYKDRLWYLHLKGFKPIGGTSNYFESIAKGIFCELSDGEINFKEVLDWLNRKNYQGWALVEQDILPGMGSPKKSAQKNFDYLKSIGF